MAACDAGRPVTASAAAAPEAAAIRPPRAIRPGGGAPATVAFRQDRGVRARTAGPTLDPPKEGPC